MADDTLDEAAFRTLFETLAFDETRPPSESIRPPSRSGPTLAFSGLPSVEFSSTNPELELGDTIGQGGMGVVRSAKQIALHREVAVKTLRKDRMTETARDGLLHEALVTGGLQHPNVIPIYSLGQTENGSPVIVMKRIEGTPWDECIAEPERAPDFDADDPLGWHLDIFVQVCLAVQFAHSRDILHRDIKPENVMIGEFGEVYLLDWGVAVTTADEKAEFLQHVSASSGVCGTPNYMAPEMTTGDPDELGVETDVYLLGAALYHAVTGEPPHSGRSLFEIMFHAHESRPVEIDEVPEELVAICRRAMSRRPEDRFASADDLRRAIIDFQRHRNSLALADEAAERLDELRALVERAAESDEPRIRNLFGECRFGFEQALRVWPENERAAAGLDDAVATLMRFELGAENLGAARALASELREPRPDLEAELDELQREQESRQREVDELRGLRDDFDLSTGAETRALSAAAGVILFTLMPLLSGWTVRAEIMEFSSELLFGHGFFITVLFFGMALAFRSELWKNVANRRLLRILVAYGVWTPVFRFVAWQLELEPLSTLVLETTVYALVFAAVAIMSNQLAFFGVLVYLAAAVGSVAAPYYIWEITAVANFLAIGFIAFVWATQREA